MTGDGVRAAADAAENGSRGDYYAYFKVAGSNRIGRPLQPVPAETIGAPGQSGHSEAEMDRMVNGNWERAREPKLSIPFASIGPV